MRDIGIDTAVIGSGVAGLLVACLASEQGRRVFVFDRKHSAGQIPGRDSQRNHRWLQSGLLYAKDYGAGFARSMWQTGRELVEFAGIPVPREGGVFCVPVEWGADHLPEIAAECHIEHQVAQLKPAEAFRILGSFHSEGSYSYRVPDAPFDESQMLYKLDKRACRSGVVFVPEGDVRVDRDRDGIVVCHDGERYRPKTAIIAAGCGTPTILDALGFEHTISVFRSCLLRLYETTKVLASEYRPPAVPLIVDRKLSLSVVRTEPRSDGARCVIVGGGARRPIESRHAHARAVSRAEREEIIEKVGPALQSHMRHAVATAGHKTERVDENGESSVRPYVKNFGEVDRPVIVVLPGKATTALAAARKAVDLLKESDSRQKTNIPIYVRNRHDDPDYRLHTEFPNLDETKVEA